MSSAASESLRRWAPSSRLCPTGHALLLEGEAGIGKTTVWLAAVRAADDRGFRVLQARPTESESKLSWTSARRHCWCCVFDEVAIALPDPQERRRGCHLLCVATDEPADARVRATAPATVLTVLAEDLPVLLAIDDVQWLDGASVGALAFVANGSRGGWVCWVTGRTEGVAGVPLDLDRALPEEGAPCSSARCRWRRCAR